MGREALPREILTRSEFSGFLVASPTGMTIK
jgi:hypothetical protein